jgi:S1-C subfamily serine protease
VIVTDVELGSPAAQVGIFRGDVILALNDKPVQSTYHFQKLIHELAFGPVIFTVDRVGQINRFVIDRG